MKRSLVLAGVLIIALAVAWFGGLGRMLAPNTPLSIIAGSENKALEQQCRPDDQLSRVGRYFARNRQRQGRRF